MFYKFYKKGNSRKAITYWIDGPNDWMPRQYALHVGSYHQGYYNTETECHDMALKMAKGEEKVLKVTGIVD